MAILLIAENFKPPLQLILRYPGYMMPSFIYDIPNTQLALYCIYLATGLTWAGILFIKPILRLLVGGQPDVNDTISYATTVFSLFYGLLVGMLTVTAYQNYEDVEQNAFREVSSIGTLYYEMNNYPEPIRTQMREMLRDYTLFTIYKDWPAHKRGNLLAGGGNRVYAMRQRLAGFVPATVPQEINHREVVRYFHEFDQSRRERLEGVFTRIPQVLWYALGAGALINITLLIMLKMRPVQHLVLGTITSFFLGVMLFVVISLDDPFRGANGVTPDSFMGLWERRMVLDEPWS